ncbi:MAG TPA: tRNA 2-thiouridine(34) synthase MnmA [Streptosporangiaceae bacterium]|jgi:tRNA-specific 2-thiouridylase
MTTPAQTSPMKVLAAMSGGVDSAVAAARAAEAGYDVTGVHLALSENPSSYRTGARGCCTLEDARDARRAADVIGIPFYVWDMAERFAADVVDDFVAEYARGNTPNPCLRCNEKIKFAAVLDRAVALGFDAVCTGHHASIDASTGQPRLVRSVDQGKDQSYVLAVLTPAQLSRALFPLGDSTKDQVRVEAAQRGLAVADKPDSHDICFIADGDTRAFLRRKLGEAPGPIVDVDGQEIGRHDGSYGFTVGQRRGLRIDTPASDGKPRYVLDIEPVSSTVRVGPAAALDVTEIIAARPVWTGCEPPSGPIEAAVQLRAHGETFPATCEPGPDGDSIKIRLHTPARGIARGQAAVLYDGQIVLGSGTIAKTASAAPSPN